MSDTSSGKTLTPICGTQSSTMDNVRKMKLVLRFIARVLGALMQTLEEICPEPKPIVVQQQKEIENEASKNANSNADSVL